VRKELAVPGLVYTQRSAAQFLAVELGDRVFRIFHFDETETAGAVPLAMGDDLCRPHSAKLLKMFLDLFFGGIVREIAHKNFFYQKILLMVVDK
jgi:hypothetical protein